MRVAFVVQRYGEEVNGGAEQMARWLAERLLALAEVHVFTTCALDYYTWADHYPPGDSVLNGVRLHRFRVDAPRDWPRSQRQTRDLLLQPHTPADEIAWIRAMGPYSTPLFDALRAAHQKFDCFIFFTYLYATTYFGLPLVADRAWLVPNAHEEKILHLAAFRDLFHRPRLLIYNTATEQRFVQAAWHNDRVPQMVAGVGINAPAAVDPQRFRARFGVEGDFLLYVGRIDESKNVPQLLDNYLDYRANGGQALPLLLAGKAGITLPRHPDIRHIGFISEQEKFDGMAAATVFIVPSRYESLSMVTLEAWLMQTPTLVNAECSVLKDQTRASNGGLYYGSRAEFDAALTWLLDHPAERAVMGRSGRAFVDATYRWELIVAKYAAAFAALAAG